MLFDIALSDALKLIKIEVDKQFLINQRLPGRPGCLGGIYIKGAIKENIHIQRKSNELKRKEMYNTSCASTSTLLDNSFEHNLETDSLESSDISELETGINSLELIEPPTKKKKCRGKINFITPKLAGALDRCQLSI